MIVLGIETSCDETAVAVVREDKTILSHIVSSQEDHRVYGGVIPEIAARSHLQHLDIILEKAMDEAQLGFQDLDAIAAAGGPGLIGGVIVGVMVGKGLALATHRPFIPVNHLEGHALTIRLTDTVEFPYLLLLVSGGHCQFLIVENVGAYTYLGGTLDDALGECLDKTARLLGGPYPGGPFIEALAKGGNPAAFALPHPLKGKPGCDFSFSGLKTAARHLISNNMVESDHFRADFAASLQKTIGDILEDRCRNALDMARKKHPSLKTLVVSGGVAANQYFKERLTRWALSQGVNVLSPPPALCTDNGAMIAWAGLEHLRAGAAADLDFAPKPRWPLEELI